MKHAAKDWEKLRFGVEIEFVGGDPERLELLPGWNMALDEQQTDESGEDSGSELQSPPLLWEQRGQIAVMADRLKQQGASVNWSCGLHVHVGLERYGEAILLPLLDAALHSQHDLQELFDTSPHRMIFCPPVTADRVSRFRMTGDPETLHNSGRPQSHRFGINIRPWFEIGTVEMRYANGSLEAEEICRATELCLRFVAAVGAGSRLPADPQELAEVLGAAAGGYPPRCEPPKWRREQIWLDEMLIPVFAPLVEPLIPGGEIHHLRPEPGGMAVYVEDSSGSLSRLFFRAAACGWELCR